MGTTYYDSQGSATFLPNGVPIYAVKKATFKDKMGVLHSLLKMVYNSVTYNFTETAQGGAVIFQNDYTGWEFVAPDGRLDFSAYNSMTLGEALSAIRQTLVTNPVPSWDKFAEWVYSTGSYPKYVLANSKAYVSPYGGSYTQISSPDFTSMSGNTFVDFLDVLINAMGNSNLPMSEFRTGETEFKYLIDLQNTSGNTLINMTFVFRE